MRARGAEADGETEGARAQDRCCRWRGFLAGWEASTTASLIQEGFLEEGPRKEERKPRELDQG